VPEVQLRPWVDASKIPDHESSSNENQTRDLPSTKQYYKPRDREDRSEEYTLDDVSVTVV
jgi:hypothetical protein